MDEPKQSIWKKEISFKRKPKAERAEAPEAPSEPKKSIWKKEVSFKRKRKAAPAPESLPEMTAPEPEPEPQPEPAAPAVDPRPRGHRVRHPVH